MTEFLATLCYLAGLAVVVLASRCYSPLKRKANEKTEGTWSRLGLEILTVLVVLIVVGGLIGLGVYAVDAIRAGVWSPLILAVATFFGWRIWDAVFHKGWFAQFTERGK